MNQGTWVAIDASTDRRSWASTLARAHHDFVGGGQPAQLLRSPVASSWRRSATAGIDPGRGTAPLKLSAEQASERWAQHPLSVAEPMLRELLADVRSDDDQVVLVCDADGVLLWIDGEPAVLDAAHEVHLEPGALWSEEAAGTNAMGTALEIDHPIQIFSAEHFTQSVHGWTCCAAPVNDPETGRRLGVIDLSGEISTAHPHSLALIEAAARMTEAELQRRTAERHARIRDRWAGRIGNGPGRASALASSAGTVLVAHEGGWVGRRVELPAEGGAVKLPGGVVAHAEPTAGGDAFLLWRAADATPSTATDAGALKIDALGRDRAVVETPSGRVELSPRHSEIVVLLALVPDGFDADRLRRELYGEDGQPVTLRAELSRLRRTLGERRLPCGEHRLGGRLRADFVELERLLRTDRPGAALERYRGPLLPASTVPLVVEARERLEHGLREAALRAADAGPLSLWLETPSGRDDVVACRALIGRLGAADPGRTAALSRLRRLTGAS